ncbi:adenylate/guanylate cyclase [Thecamonas trahens ATCC 50062]|uniref:Adenylate/guanylate cyclase n=1 Tax=Thecamonas trahens ATCC 50062 TaxID=461836 RepID=A0A0L0D4C4_THETB|nr:adenylate/guanylate cyclase [Thecamonas trahens ATCC 50062]KNC47159.1 adenylate/guanylate cyclase [Thecamonas trahens ATCC 50062]|eukprot:XP_013759933.1 adenylate/guanylate cyclase [Thecamonas trahens ATCC 50062]
MVKKRYAVSGAGFVSDMSSSVLLLHLISEVLEINLFEDPRVVPTPTTQQGFISNVAVCLELVAEQGIKVNCRSEQVVEGMAEKTVYLLLQVARHYYQTKLTLAADEGESGSKKFNSFLLGAVRKFLGRFGFGRVVDKHSLINFNKNWVDGVFFTALAKAALPSVFKDVSMHDLLSASNKCGNIDRVVNAFHKRLGLPKLITPELFVAEPEDCTLHLYLAMFLEQMAGAKPGEGFSKSSTSVADEQTQSLRELVASLKTKIFDMEASSQEMLQRNDELQLQLYDTQADAIPLLEKIDRAHAELETARTKIQTLRDEVSALEASRAQVVAEAKRRLQLSEEAKAVAERRFKEALARSQEIAKQCRALKVQFDTIIEEKSKRASDDVVAPDGHVTIMFTDIESSTALWEHDAEKMAEALRQHNSVIRKALSQYNGYEVKTEGDAFMVAFSSGWSAILCAIHIQRELLRVAWPEAILQTQTGAPQYNNKGTLIWRGVRVRMGLHAGEPELREDPVTHRVDYFGPMVNRSARIEGHTAGGQVNVSQAVFDDVCELLEASEELEYKLLGEFDLKGIREKMNIYQIIPYGLEDRIFESSHGNSAATVKLIGGDPDQIQHAVDDLVQKNDAVLAELNEAGELISHVDKDAAALLDNFERMQQVTDPVVLQAQLAEAFTRLEQQNQTQSELRATLEIHRAETETLSRTLATALAQVKDYQSMFSRMPAKSVRAAADDFLKLAISPSESEASLRAALDQARSTISTLETELRLLRRRFGEMMSLPRAQALVLRPVDPLAASVAYALFSVSNLGELGGDVGAAPLRLGGKSKSRSRRSTSVATMSPGSSPPISSPLVLPSPTASPSSAVARRKLSSGKRTPKSARSKDQRFSGSVPGQFSPIPEIFAGSASVKLSPGTPVVETPVGKVTKVRVRTRRRRQRSDSSRRRRNRQLSLSGSRSGGSSSSARSPGGSPSPDVVVVSYSNAKLAAAGTSQSDSETSSDSFASLNSSASSNDDNTCPLSPSAAQRGRRQKIENNRRNSEAKRMEGAARPFRARKTQSSELLMTTEPATRAQRKRAGSGGDDGRGSGSSSRKASGSSSKSRSRNSGERDIGLRVQVDLFETGTGRRRGSSSVSPDGYGSRSPPRAAGKVRTPGRLSSRRSQQKQQRPTSIREKKRLAKGKEDAWSGSGE